MIVYILTVCHTCIGEPTIQQKAEMFVDVLNLGLKTPPTSPPVGKPGLPGTLPPPGKPATVSPTRPANFNATVPATGPKSLQVKRGIQRCPAQTQSICTNTNST